MYMTEHYVYVGTLSTPTHRPRATEAWVRYQLESDGVTTDTSFQISSATMTIS